MRMRAQDVLRELSASGKGPEITLEGHIWPVRIRPAPPLHACMRVRGWQRHSLYPPVALCLCARRQLSVCVPLGRCVAADARRVRACVRRCALQAMRSAIAHVFRAVGKDLNPRGVDYCFELLVRRATRHAARRAARVQVPSHCTGTAPLLHCSTGTSPCYTVTLEPPRCHTVTLHQPPLLHCTALWRTVVPHSGAL
jgi:hypothetical protein